MNGFDPGDGWRKVAEADWNAMDALTESIEYHIDGSIQYWVRQEPVPPLPTEPGYYVDTDGCAWRLDAEGAWDDTFGNPMDEGQVRPPLTRYEPPAVTAKAVLDRVCEHIPTYGDKDRMWDIAREFGVQP